MTTLLTRSKDTIVATIAAGMQGRIARFLNFAVGSVFLALAEAHAGVALWLQGEIWRVLKVTRAATSTGEDLDSFVADYGLVRQPGVPASGLVTFSRYTASSAEPVIPIGAIVQTGDGSQRFTVYADPSNPAYSAPAQGYVLPAGQASVSVPVVADVAPGADSGNIGPGAISLVASTVPGVDVVINPTAFANGLDAESDDALRQRFQLFINSLSKGTEGAIGYAITSLRQGLQYQIVNNRDPDGTYDPGFVTVFVDDGSGALPQDVLNAASAAVADTVAAGIRFGVFRATPILATISLTIETAPGFYHNDLVAAVTKAVAAYINGLKLGDKLRFTRIEQIAYDTSPGVTNVTSVSLNGGTADLVPAAGQTIKAAAVIVS